MLKEQNFENFDEFKPEEWKPIPDKEFCFNDGKPKDGIYGRFGFDAEWGIWRGIIIERDWYSVANDIDFQGVIDIMNNIGDRIEAWKIYPEKVTWYWRGHKGQVEDYGAALSNLITPKPSMVYKTCEVIDNCVIQTKYRIERSAKEIYLEIIRTIQNDDIDLETLWDVYVEQIKKRLCVPFTATLETFD